jgi:hypothetical protein
LEIPPRLLGSLFHLGRSAEMDRIPGDAFHIKDPG